MSEMPRGSDGARTAAETAAAPRHTAGWGSDHIAEAIRATGVPYIAVNPGASYRGLHDSLVNYLGDTQPTMLLCLHEEHAVAIAHGYAKVTETPMAVALHANVGLMHATMAIFNAYSDRVPMLMIGATGPMDAERRRPWIDWIHSAADQAALVRPYVKWDDQPMSVPATVASIIRGDQLTRAHPAAPVYVCLDVAVQEQPFDQPVPIAGAVHAGIGDPHPGADEVAAAAAILRDAKRPVILMGRVSRDPAEWDRRVVLAETLGARVISDLKAACGFPTGHPLHSGSAGTYVTPENLEVIRDADVILSLDWVDLGGTLRAAFGETVPTARVVNATSDHVLFNGWVKNDHVLAPVDVWLPTRPDLAVAAVLRELAPDAERPRADVVPTRAVAPPVPTGEITVEYLAAVTREALSGLDATLVRVPLSWEGAFWDVTDPLDFLGGDGGAGIGSGPGMAIGAALALRDHHPGRIPVSILGDGDFLMGVTALWTAARYRLPGLMIVANNSSFFNDELHQQRMALLRDRDLGNAHIGVRIDDPDPDLAAFARANGVTGIGPITDPDELPAVIERALEHVREGQTVVIDVRVRRNDLET